jgi:hypothetical protein
MASTGHGLYRAEHRALRELYAVARQTSDHWERLAGRVGGQAEPALRRGAADCEELLAELASRTGERGLHGFPAADGVGARLAGLRNNAGDLLLERNQALRSAVLDIQHLTTLLGYLGRLATTRGDDPLAGFHKGWEVRLREIETDARNAAIDLGCARATASRARWAARARRSTTPRSAAPRAGSRATPTHSRQPRRLLDLPSREEYVPREPDSTLSNRSHISRG